MQKKLILFIALSLAFHLLVLSMLDIKPESRPEPVPVSVDIIEKKKDTQTQDKQPAQDKKIQQDEYVKDTPIDEELETSLDQKDAVPEKTPQKEIRKDDTAGLSPDKKSDLPLPEINRQRDDINLPDVGGDEKLTREQIEGILNPDEIIQQYADQGGSPAGEDYVSMQYVKYKYQSYFHKFARRLYQVWLYPDSSVSRGEEGTVRISFMIAKDGMISSIKVLESSGYPDLDREAVSALKKSAGVPLPESYELNFLKVDAYFRYVLHRGYMVY